MRKVRDYDAELKALSDKARALKAKRVEQLGQLVAMTGADALDAETLAGVLLDAIVSKDTSAKEAWRAKGAAFFRRRGRKPVPSELEGGGGAAQLDGSGAQAEPGGDAAGGSGGAANG
ncbi:conjugal transfer protein TraD [Mesorhizobium sp.]|uniref:conjugal transfer protein TraD n=1 Tax=Mesorhizobium sp. TaxID=1871066 RepID=UPI0025F0B082|nr:conjugal transfer protein TraD [Mesorhizobium sp.]